MKTRSGVLRYKLAFIGSLLIFLNITLSGSTGFKNINPVQWMPWEDSLKSSIPSKGKAEIVRVIFTGPGKTKFTNYAFTDDGISYRFRAAFPCPGQWKWNTDCTDRSDKGLHNQKGIVVVDPYTGENPLYKHGDLKVSNNRRYLVHFDETPFLWMGETGWRSTEKSTMSEWEHYIDTRVSQKFTVIQVSPKGTSKNPGIDLAGVSFRQDGRPDPKFWSELEEKIRYANSRGILIFMVGISKVWSDEFARNSANQDFGTYITGRMAPYFVIFSPSFDQVFDPGNDSMAVVLNRMTSHLVTQHPGTNYEANLKYRNSPSTDFCGMQSGHHGGNLIKAYNAARQWTLDMWNGQPVKPVINIEAMYDGRGGNAARNWREKDVRRLGWMTWLSGSMGYTYGAGDVPPKVPEGAGGVWRFNGNHRAYDFWGRAIHWPSAGQMTIMHDFFRSIEWWKLAPCHDVILNQDENDTLRMVASSDPGKELFLAYLPDNPMIELSLSAIPEPAESQWFNPLNGKFVPVTNPVTSDKKVTFRKPDGWEDALLVLKKK